MTDLLARITIDPQILLGKPTVRRTRISVEHILKALAAGVPQEDLLAYYPELEPEDIFAVLQYAAELVGETSSYAIAGYILKVRFPPATSA